MLKAPAAIPTAARKSARPPRKFTTTRQWVQDEFVGWCGENNVDPADGLPALRAYVEHRLPLDKNYSIKTVRIYVSGALEAMRGLGVDISSITGEVGAIIEPFLERERAPAPAVARPTRPVRRSTRRVGLARLVEWVMNREDVPLAARVQDRALLLVGFTAGLTPDELVRVKVGDVRALPWSGVMLYLHKVDRFERESVEVFFWPYREPKALDAASDSAVPLFVDPETGKPLDTARIVAYINHAVAAATGQEKYRGHFFRGGKLGLGTIGQKVSEADLLPQSVSLNPSTPEKAFQIQARLWGFSEYNVPLAKSARAAKKPE
jgi:hypothetical protein